MVLERNLYGERLCIVRRPHLACLSYGASGMLDHAAAKRLLWKAVSHQIAYYLHRKVAACFSREEYALRSVTPASSTALDSLDDSRHDGHKSTRCLDRFLAIALHGIHVSLRYFQIVPRSVDSHMWLHTVLDLGLANCKDLEEW